ncbi:hypothetical protein E2C01_000939 [Portunus trituberculatus]|uniref:Uncharacterized protein n=1 Tax=Portunus trituberculatus TaxID=210409 RepID=A0A5B7CHX2_PORTR|nr:hypothetical protein [Portunus trituberculatus]
MIFFIILLSMYLHQYISVTRSCLSIFSIRFTNLHFITKFFLSCLSFKVGNSIFLSLSS